MTFQVSSIFDKFKLYVKSTGLSFDDADQMPLLESTALDYPGYRMTLRGRDRKALTGPANGIATKIKWKHTGNYDARTPLTPVEWSRAGSLEFLKTGWCHEFGSITIGENEVEFNAGGAMDSESMRQKFDDVLDNNRQDFYVDIASKIEDTFWRVPDARMENGNGNVPRSLFFGLNEWKTGHGVAADGAFLGYNTIEGQALTTPGAKFGAQVEVYDGIGQQDGTAKDHLFQAIARGFRNVNFRAVPGAESLTQGTEGQREIFASIEGALLMDRVLNAHDNMAAVEGAANAIALRTRFTGAEIVDVVGMEDFLVCPAYDGSGDPTATTNQGTAVDPAYYTELTSPNAVGPRFYVPYQPHMQTLWKEGCFMDESPWYTLDETIPDAMVMHIKNYRNMHFKSFRRGLVIRPKTDIAGF